MYLTLNPNFAFSQVFEGAPLVTGVFDVVYMKLGYTHQAVMGYDESKEGALAYLDAAREANIAPISTVDMFYDYEDDFFRRGPLTINDAFGFQFQPWWDS